MNEEEKPMVVDFDTMRLNGNQEIAEEITGLNHKLTYDNAFLQSMAQNNAESRVSAQLEAERQRIEIEKQKIALQREQIALEQAQTQHLTLQSQLADNRRQVSDQHAANMANHWNSVNANHMATLNAQNYSNGMNNAQMMQVNAIAGMTPQVGLNGLNGAQIAGSRILEPNDAALASLDSANSAQGTHGAAGTGAVQTALGVSELSAARQVADVNIMNTQAQMNGILSQVQNLTAQITALQAVVTGQMNLSNGNSGGSVVAGDKGETKVSWNS